MSANDITEVLEEAVITRFDRWIAIFIAFLAAMLAVGEMGGNNVEQDAMVENLAASNTFAQYQSKNIRQFDANLAADNFEIILLSQPDLDEKVRAVIEERVQSYRTRAERYQIEPVDGKKDLLIKAFAHVEARDKAMAKDPYFDFAMALVQIAIVLASIAIIAKGRVFLYLSVGCGTFGALLLFNGFTLLFTIPFIA